MNAILKPESIPHRNPERLWQVQDVERQFAAAHELLRRSQTLSSTVAGNLSLRLSGEETLLIASFNGPHAGRAAVFDFDLSEEAGHASANLKEVAALHIAILRERPDANVVVHTHSPYLTAWSLAGRALPARYATLLNASDEDIPLARWGARYAIEPVREVLAHHPRATAALLANHGPFAWGNGVHEVARLLSFLEEAAHFTLLAEQLGGAQPLPAGAYEAVQAGRKKFYGG